MHKHKKHPLFLLLCCICPIMLCAQTPCTDIRVHHYDTICEGMEYNFNGRMINYEGVFFDTLPRAHSTCDSIIILHLALLPYPTGTIRAIHHCADSQAYRLVSSSEQFYYSWTSQPEDPSLLGQEHADQVWVRPSTPTTYYLYIDYRPSPQCPATGSITLNPLEPVKASMFISVDQLSYDRMTFTAKDLSLGTRECQYGGWSGRHWYLNGQLQTTIEQTTSFEVKPWWGDSVEVKLVGYTPTCADSVTRIIPFHHVSLYFPNIFSPSQPPNHLFLPTVQGLLEYSLTIYDRQGTIVFQASDPQQGWDGTRRGTPCPAGTYTYHCRYREISTPTGWQSTSGTITLVR